MASKASKAVKSVMIPTSVKVDYEVLNQLIQQSGVERMTFGKEIKKA
jgi:hypothetical protein